MHGNASTAEWQRDTAGPDTELQCRLALGQVGEEVDGRVEQRRLEDLGPQRPVATGDPRVEVGLGHGQSIAIA